MGYSTMLAGQGYAQPRNSVNQIVNYLKQNNFQTESEIQQNVFNFFRNETWVSNKKYADLLRRAVSKGLIYRVKHRKNQSQFVYFIVPQNN